MALTLISIDSFPTYLALSTDISGSMIDGATLIGKTVYTTDDKKWYILTPSGSEILLQPFVMPKLET